jgi:DNA-binding GntR family transcriptional regulator
MSAAAPVLPETLDGPDVAPVLRRQSDDAYEAIARAIVRCDLAPGSTVSEAELAASFGL